MRSREDEPSDPHQRASRVFCSTYADLLGRGDPSSGGGVDRADTTDRQSPSTARRLGQLVVSAAPHAGPICAAHPSPYQAPWRPLPRPQAQQALRLRAMLGLGAPEAPAEPPSPPPTPLEAPSCPPKHAAVAAMLNTLESLTAPGPQRSSSPGVLHFANALARQAEPDPSCSGASSQQTALWVAVHPPQHSQQQQQQAQPPTPLFPQEQAAPAGPSAAAHWPPSRSASVPLPAGGGEASLGSSAGGQHTCPLPPVQPGPSTDQATLLDRGWDAT